MTAIVNSYRDEFISKINESWTISLRIDGSIDFSQIDKIYVMTKIINLDGSELFFIGVGEQKERRALGLKNTALEAMKISIGDPKNFFLVHRWC